MDSPVNIELDLIEDSDTSAQPEMKIKFDREKLAEQLSTAYDPVLYDYDTLSQSFHETRQINGQVTLRENEGVTPFSEMMYLEAIVFTLLFLLSYIIIKSTEIYLLALFGDSSSEGPQFASYLLDYLLIPASRIAFNDTYRFINEMVVDPLILIVSALIYLFIMRIVEKKVTDELMVNHHFGVLMSVRLKNLLPVKGSEIAYQVEKILGQKAEMRVTLVYNSLEIDKHFQEYNKDLIQIKFDLANKKEVDEHKIKDFTDQRIEINKKQTALCKNHVSLRSSYALVSFFRYEDTYNFFKKAAVYVDNPEEGRPKVFQKYSYTEDVHFAPDPYDIDWNYYAKRETFNSKLIDFAMRIFFFLMLPAFTYFIHYTFTKMLVKVITVGTKDSYIENPVVFTVTRLIISAIYSQLCSLAIDYYFQKKAFKTHSKKIESKFYFYNFYFMLNQIAADFYATISAGISTLSTDSTQTIIKNHQAFIFIAALKVGLMILISPLVQLLVSFIPKIWGNIKTKYWPEKCMMLHAIERDLPVEHDLGNMASFLIQCVFYISFFSGFMMPITGVFIVLGLMLFYWLEKHFIMNVYSMQKGLTLVTTNMIYKLFFWAYVSGNVLSIGNASLILTYFNTFNLAVLRSFLLKMVEVGVVIVAIIFAIYMNIYFRDFNIRFRVLERLVYLGTMASSTEKEVFDNKYKNRNPHHKAKQKMYSV